MKHGSLMLPFASLALNEGSKGLALLRPLPQRPFFLSSRLAASARVAKSRKASGGEPKKLYRAFSQEEPSLPIFSRDWWLDAVAGPDGWDVVLAVRGGEVTAAMPYQLRRRFGLRWLSQPRLTPVLGPWIRPSSAKPAVALAQEKEQMEELIANLPSFDYFTQNWHHSQSNWLPFYWRGFSQTTRYSYVLSNLGDQAALWRNLEKSVRTTIRKAQNRFGLKVRRDLGLEVFLELNRKTYLRQGLQPPYDDAQVRRLDAACAARNCREIFIAVDEQGRPHAGEYMVWDENSAYALMGGADPSLRHSGATSLCLWEAINQAAQLAPSYDFCGSMIESVERQFRAFGAQQRPYFRITKARNPLLRLIV